MVTTVPSSPLPKKKIWNKHFPTLLGLGILVVALVSGIILIGGNTSVFSPRATPETTPQNISVSNKTETGFTISFTTADTVAGFIKYGTSPTKLDQQASDDRDQLTGTVGAFNTHHITLRGLTPQTTYYYELGTGTRETFDDNGSPYSLTTFARGNNQGAAQTAYGTILDQTGNPAVGSLVFINAEGIETLSTLVKDSGSWAVPLSNARTASGEYVDASKLTQLSIKVQGSIPTNVLTNIVSMEETQPVATMTFGQTPVALSTPVPMETATPIETAIPMETTPPVANNLGTGYDPLNYQIITDISSNSAVVQDSTPSGDTLDIYDTFDSSENMVDPGGLGGLVDTAEGLIDLAKLESASASGTMSTPTIQTSTPIIKGVATPLTKVVISVHSDNQIEQEVISDENGNFELDLAQLSEGLEAGEHTVNYSYIDPNTGQEVSKTHTFIVDAPEDGQLLAQANTAATTSGTTGTNSGPYGSGNPYPVGGTATSSSLPTSTPKATNSGIVYPATGSGIPVSGSAGTTVALIMGGLLFLMAGTWSYYLAQKASLIDEEDEE